MKKFTILMAIAALFTSAAFAQEIAFGFKAGANLANIGDLPEGAESFDMLIGAHVGPFVKLPINENFSIIPEILYSMKGAKMDDDALSLSYLEIPIMANYQLESGLNFELGPYVGFLLAADAEGTDVKEFMESTDFGIGLGLGYRMESGLGFGARYSLGLATLNKEQTFTIIVGTDPNTGQPIVATVTQEAYGKNSVIGISVSYLFGQN